MGIFNNLRGLYKAYKVLNEGKNPSLVKAGQEIDDPMREKANEIKNINYQKKKIMKELEVEKEKIKGELEIRKLQAELEELRDDLGDYDEDDEQTAGEMSPKDMLMMNVVNAFTKNMGQAPTQPKHDQQFSLYPTGTTDGQPAQIIHAQPEQISQRQFSDDDLKAYLGFLSPDQQNIIKQIPNDDLLRAKELLNQ